jgi:hypothetical protein
MPVDSGTENKGGRLPRQKRERKMAETKQDFTVELTVNGKKVGLNPYVTSVFALVVQGLVHTLKNIPELHEIDLSIRRKN